MLFGRISAHPRQEEPEEEEEREEVPPVVWDEWEPEDEPQSPSRAHPPPQSTRQAPQSGTQAGRWAHNAQSPVQGIEVCTPAQATKRQRLGTPLHLYLVRMPQPIGAEATPRTPATP